MANVDFYALQEDIRTLFHFIYEETDLRVFESYSEPDAELREFRSYRDLSDAFPIGVLELSHTARVNLQLWSPSITADMAISRFALRPTKRRPHTFRHRISGIGLIQLYLGGVHKGMITDSHYGHWNEAGARQRAGGNPDAVDWVALGQLSGRIQRYLRNRIAVAKVIGRPILPAAFAALQNGDGLWNGSLSFQAQSPEIELLRRSSGS